jgi:hypothetical protein
VLTDDAAKPQAAIQARFTSPLPNSVSRFPVRGKIDRMIRGMHMFYSSQPQALRAFFRDKLGLPATDVGDGWLFFDAPEADLGVHPTEGNEDAVGIAGHLLLLR